MTAPRTVLEAPAPEGAADRPGGSGPGTGPGRPWRPSGAGAAARVGVLAVLGLAVLALPHLVPSDQVNIVSTAAVYALVALSMNILMGYTGQVSLGHQAFLGVGAFTAGFVITEVGVPWLLGATAAVLTGALAALVLGLVALRVEGLYLALVTLAYGLLAQNTIFRIRAVTRGGAGMPAPRPAFARGDVAFVYLCLAAVVLVWALDWRLTATKAGRAIRALRDDPRVAASWGINVTGYKLLGFVLSGMVAGLAGALFASIEQIVVAPTFSLALALTFVLMTVVGGLGSRPGVVIGGVVFATLGHALTAAHDHLAWWPAFLDSRWEPVIGGLLLIVTLVSFPGGIAEQLAPVLRWLRFGRFRGTPPARAATPAGGAAGDAAPGGRDGGA